MAFWRKVLRPDKVGASTPIMPPPSGAQLTAHGMMHSQQSANLIQVPDISRKLVTRYGLREKAPSPTLAAEVVPVVLVDDLVGESDLIRPRIRPAAGTHQLVPAAQFAQLGILNPTDSGVIVHVYYFMLSGSTTGQWNVHFTGTAVPSTYGTTGYRNGLFPAQSPAAQTFGALGGIGPGGVIEAKMRIGTQQFGIFPFDAVLDEGQSLVFHSQTALTGTYEASWFWSEEDKK